MLKISEIKNNYESYEKETLLEAYSVVNANKNMLSDLEKSIKEKLCSSLSVGEQLSLDFGSNNLVATNVELDDIGFDCSDEQLYTECSGTIYATHGVNKTAIKKDYKKGVLPSTISNHIVITKQTEFKISKKAKKGDE